MALWGGKRLLIFEIGLWPWRNTTEFVLPIKGDVQGRVQGTPRILISQQNVSAPRSAMMVPGKPDKHAEFVEFGCLESSRHKWVSLPSWGRKLGSKIPKKCAADYTNHLKERSRKKVIMVEAVMKTV